MAFALSNRRLDGCLFGPPSKKDFRTAFKDLEVPDQVDLRPYCTEVENQGQIGSCTANASVGALEFLLKRRDGQAPHLSRMFVYYNARRMKGTIGMDSGAQIRESMASLLAFGACREDIWPYDPALFAAEPSPDAYNNAVVYQALQYARVDGGQGAVGALARGLPVVFGTVIPEACYVEAEHTGIIRTPTQEELNTPGEGGHSMLIVGYDNGQRTFIVRNSWGAAWGDQGYCYIPYDVMDLCSRPEEFWVVAEIEKQTGFQLLRPGQGRAASFKNDDDDDDDYAHRQQGGTLGGLTGTTAKMRDEIRSRLEADLSKSSKKIDDLLSGKTGGANAPRQTGGIVPCTACMGNGICPFCHGTKPGCVRCKGTGACAACGGTGVL